MSTYIFVLAKPAQGKEIASISGGKFTTVGPGYVTIDFKLKADSIEGIAKLVALGYSVETKAQYSKRVQAQLAQLRSNHAAS